MIAAVESVDAVISFEEDTPLELIAALLPDVLVKGGDYTVETVVGADGGAGRPAAASCWSISSKDIRRPA